MKKKRTKKSVEKALDLIEVLKDKKSVGVTELSQILGLNKNNVFRLLITLSIKGLVEQDEKKNYKLGIGFLYLEKAYIHNLDFFFVAKPYLKNLRNKTGETVYLSILHGDEVIYLQMEESKKAVLVNSRIAKRYPAETTASGKALRYARSKDFILEYDFEDTESEVSEIATVIKNRFGDNVASLSIVAPINRLNSTNVYKFETYLLNTAKEISKALGFNG